jgi:hypothetical protein
LGLDALFRTLANRNHCDYRCHTYDDSKHGKQCSQFISLQRPDGYLQKIAQFHFEVFLTNKPKHIASKPPGLQLSTFNFLANRQFRKCFFG